MPEGILSGPGEGELLRNEQGNRVVVEGELDVYVNGEWTRAAPGAFLSAAPGVEHGFTKRDSGTVRFLNIHAPGGFEHSLRAMSVRDAQP